MAALRTLVSVFEASISGQCAPMGKVNAPLQRLLDKAEANDGLDKAIGPIQALANRVIRGRRQDFLHGVWLGHPVHPALVQVPVGAWLSTTILDAVPGTARASTVLVGAGTAAAAPAALAGWTDWASAAKEQQRVGLFHAAANAIAIGLQAASFVARLRGRHRTGRRLSLIAMGLASGGAYLGAHLAYRQAAGVNHAAPRLPQITPGWHPVCDLASLADDRPVSHDVDGVPVVLARAGDTVAALLGPCAHQSGPLGEGEIVTVDGAECVVCPWHGSTFRLADGAVVGGPAATDQPTLPSRVRNGRVEVALPWSPGVTPSEVG